MKLEKATTEQKVKRLTHPAMIIPFAIWAALGVIWMMTAGFSEYIALTSALMMTAAFLIAAYADLKTLTIPVPTYFMLFLGGLPFSIQIWKMWFVVGGGIAAVILTVAIFVTLWIIGNVTKRMGGGDIWYCTTIGITLPVIALFVLFGGILIGALSGILVAGSKNKNNPDCYLKKTDINYWTTIPNEKGIQVPYDMPLAVPLAAAGIVVVFYYVITMMA